MPYGLVLSRCVELLAVAGDCFGGGIGAPQIAEITLYVGTAASARLSKG